MEFFPYQLNPISRGQYQLPTPHLDQQKPPPSRCSEGILKFFNSLTFSNCTLTGTEYLSDIQYRRCFPDDSFACWAFPGDAFQMTHSLVGPSKTTVLVVRGRIVTFLHPHSVQSHCLLSLQTHPTCPLSTVKQLSLLGMGGDSNQTMSSCPSIIIIDVKSLHPTFFTSMMMTAGKITGITMALMLTTLIGLAIGCFLH